MKILPRLNYWKARREHRAYFDWYYGIDYGSGRCNGSFERNHHIHVQRLNDKIGRWRDHKDDAPLRKERKNKKVR